MHTIKRKKKKKKIREKIIIKTKLKTNSKEINIRTERILPMYEKIELEK